VNRAAWTLLDRTLHGLHAAVILVCLLGWAFPPLRTAQLIVVGAVAVSWFVLGLRWGLGYCLLTDLQWKLKRAQGQTDLPDSYVKYAADRLTHADMSPKAAERIVLWGYVFSVAAGVGAAVW